MRPLWLLLLLAPSVAVADPGTSSIAMEDHLRMGAAIVRRTGERPMALGGERFDLLGGKLELSAGSLAAGQVTDLGSRFGVDVGMTFAFGPGELELGNAALGYDARLLLAIKVWSFDLPFRGQLVVCVGPEFGFGPKAWWTDEGRIGPLAQTRLMVGGDDAELELEYALLPRVFTSAEADLPARHAEHRFGLSAGAGPVGLAASYTYGREVIRGVEGQASSSHLFSIALEWRR